MPEKVTEEERRGCLDIARHRWQGRECGYALPEGVQLVPPHAGLTEQAEAEALWQLEGRSLSQIRKELGISYSTLRRLLEKEIDEEELFLGVGEHSSGYQDVMYIAIGLKRGRC